MGQSFRKDESLPKSHFWWNRLIPGDKNLSPQHKLSLLSDGTRWQNFLWREFNFEQVLNWRIWNKTPSVFDRVRNPQTVLVSLFSSCLPSLTGWFSAPPCSSGTEFSPRASFSGTFPLRRSVSAQHFVYPVVLVRLVGTCSWQRLSHTEHSSRCVPQTAWTSSSSGAKKELFLLPSPQHEFSSRVLSCPWCSDHRCVSWKAQLHLMLPSILWQFQLRDF